MNRGIERYRAVLFFVCVIAALAGLTVFEMRQPEPVPMLPTFGPDAEVAAPTPTPGPLRIYVSGAVSHPGVVTLPAGSIVEEAVAAAGGASAEADLERINLAQPVQAGSHVHVPRLGEPASPSPAGIQPSLVGINSADATLLDTLPGIGPELARRIVDYRDEQGPFETIEDLVQVPGIGPAILDNIRDLITTD